MRKKEQNEVTGSRHMCLLPVAFLCQSVLPAGIPVEGSWGDRKFVLHAVQ